MDRTLAQLEDEALHLPEEARAKLMARLLSSFQEHQGSAEEEIARAWVEEAERRDQEMSAAGDEGIPAEEVLRKVRSSIR